MNWVRTPADGAGIAELGAKGHALASAGRAGLPVPPWFAVRPGAADAARRGDGTYCCPPSLLAELEPFVDRLSPGRERLAVRSSATDEDGERSSFAGQLESFLFVAPEAVGEHVVRVWESARTTRVGVYRERHGRAHAACGSPAVLVQRMVDADVAGVAFSADPVSGRRGLAVVAAAPGVASALVAGARDGDNWRIDRTGRVEARTTEGGTPCLTDAQAQAVAALARRCARHFGTPQDIEWAYEGGRLWLLQSRPITSLGTLPDPDGGLSIWDSSNIGESYGGMTTPLTFSFVRRSYEHVYRELCRVGGVDREVIEEQRASLRRMVGYMRGRIYYNLLAWYQLLALTPFFASNRRFLDDMLGVRESTAAPVLARIHAEARKHVSRFSLARQAARLVVNLLTVERRNRRFLRNLDATLAPTALDELRADELVAHFHELDRRLLRRWDAPLVNDFFAMIFHGVLTRLARRWLDACGPGLVSDLLAGEPGLVSVEPSRRIGELARLAAYEPAFAALLREGDLGAIRAAMSQHAVFRQRFDEYVACFGDRCMEELKLESLTFEDDPTPLLRAVGQVAARPQHARSGEGGLARRLAAEESVDAALPRHPLRRRVFSVVLRHARARLRDRENLRFERTRVFARVRRVVVELGLRFHEAGLLAAPRDVFWLELDEVLGCVEGTATCTDLAGLAALRKRGFEHLHGAEPPPGRFETRGMAQHPCAIPRPVAPAAIAGGDILCATGCSPGIVRGRVRVVIRPEDANVHAGEILVAERTDPGWVVLFASAAGLVVERGNLLSHAAIVARELGLPAVIGAPGACRWLRDGDLVEIDGTTGTVRRVAVREGGVMPEVVA